MPKPKKIDTPVEKHISIPQSLSTRIDLELFSDLEGKIPFGAWAKFLLNLITEHFEQEARKNTFTHRLAKLKTAPHTKDDLCVLYETYLRAEGYAHIIDTFTRKTNETGALQSCHSNNLLNQATKE